MTIDFLSNADSYRRLGPGIAAALDYLCHTDFTGIEPGRYEIDGARVYALVSGYESRPRAAARWEAHRRHVDVQYQLLSGEERIGYAHLSTLDAGDYDNEQDVTFADGEGEYLLLKPDRFVILLPQDAHMPGLSVSLPSPVRKVVVKVTVDLA